MSHTDHLAIAERALAALSHTSPAFDEQERLDILEMALEQVTPSQCFVQRTRHGKKPHLVDQAFALGHSVATRLVVARAAQAHVDVRNGTLFVPTFTAWRGDRLADGIELWHAVTADCGPPTQSAWLKAARDAIANHHVAWLDWITHHDGFWGNSPAEALDAITALATTHIPPNTQSTGPNGDLRATAIAAVGRGWPRTEDLDPRRSHKPQVWAMGIARLGWKPPTHTRIKLFSTLVEKVRTGHGMLHFMETVKPWEQWVGLHEADAHNRLLRAAGVTEERVFLVP